ncbi:adenylate/guanylate cyclase domain-containing protein [Mangrovimonas xylaniphaga]|uniref:adenylate/guanylate cyclase domain-containing protein n=1 Tax=Mangrovimonas xylaniphaga TaxID=1645915 RepID=UPI0006B41A5B|nr:adenylate/guanylate cyclase domain-containing protein [Mangrovimonas xylaniphaga]
MLSSFVLESQVNLDSLYTIWKDHTLQDSIRTKAYSDYIWDGYLFSQPDSAFILAEKLVAFGQTAKYPRAEFAGYTIQGVSWVNRSEYQKTLQYYLKALEIAKQMGHPAALSIAYNNVGSVYHDKGEYTKALDHYIKSLKFKEPKQMGTTLNNIGTIYLNQGNYTKALEYTLQSLEINQQKGDQGAEALSLSKIGDIYRHQEDYNNAFDYYSQSLHIFEQIDHQKGIAETYGNIAQLYYLQNKYPKALDNYKKGLTYYEQLGDKNGIAVSVNNIGDIYLRQKNYPKALKHCQRGYDIAISINSLPRKRASCHCLYDIYKALGNDDQALYYLELFHTAQDSLKFQETGKKLQQMEFQAEARSLQEAHNEDIRHEENTRNISLIVGAFFLLLAGSFYMRWRYVRKSKASLQIEKERSDNLLLNILPKEVAQELKELGKSEPRKFESVTILFSDFQDFTKLTASIPATKLVVELHDIFGAFDDIMDEFGIEKIETIGDAYLAASGLPQGNPNHAINCVRAAFRMVEFLEQRNKNSDIQWNMRIGIHSGPVIAGVVGKKKFAYDLFGDSVNTASRIETNGQVSKVNISQATYDLLKNEQDLVFEPRGKIEAKGKGEIEMYFVSKK